MENIKTEARKNFYEKEMNVERIEDGFNLIVPHLTMSEILKLTRDITYDAVAYYDEKSKGYVYLAGHNSLNVEQATILQRHLSKMADMFIQSVINKRVFDNDYFELAIGDNLITKLSSENQALKKKIEKLENDLDFIRRD